jgi:hypothetical protein
MGSEDRGQYHESWWNSWGKSTAFLALVILGVIF